MRRGTAILAVALIVLAGIGIGAAAYNAGEAHGVAQQIQTIEMAAPDGTDVVRVASPGYGPGFGYGGWGHGWHGGFFPFGLLVFPLLVIGSILLVRALVWRGGRWGPGGWGSGGGGPGGDWGPGGPREAWRSRAEAWHREMHEGGDRSPGPEPETPPAPTAAA